MVNLPKRASSEDNPPLQNFLSSDPGFKTSRTPSLFQAQINFALMIDTEASQTCRNISQPQYQNLE